MLYTDPYFNRPNVDNDEPICLKARIERDELVPIWKNMLSALTFVELLTDKLEATRQQLSIENADELLARMKTETVDPIRECDRSELDDPIVRKSNNDILLTPPDLRSDNDELSVTVVAILSTFPNFENLLTLSVLPNRNTSVVETNDFIRACVRSDRELAKDIELKQLILSPLRTKHLVEILLPTAIIDKTEVPLLHRDSDRMLREDFSKVMSTTDGVYALFIHLLIKLSAEPSRTNLRKLALLPTAKVSSIDARLE